MPHAIQRGVSFLARIRAARHRIALIALFGWLLFGQTLLVVHSIDHYITGDHTPCALCVAAEHAGAASDHRIHLISGLKPEPVATGIVKPVSVDIVVAYQSRAPPEHIDS